MNKKVGDYSFIIGVVIAIVLGIFSAWIKGTASDVLVSLLVIVGLIVGFLNVAGKETQEFLTVGAILVIVAYVGGAANLAKVMYVGSYLAAVFSYMMAFVVPAVIVAALKDVYKMAKQ